MEIFSKKLYELSEIAFELSKSYNKYNSDDMVNASIVFFEVLSSMAYEQHKDKITKEQVNILMIEASKSISQTVKIFTGVDLVGKAKEIKDKESPNE